MTIELNNEQTCIAIDLSYNLISTQLAMQLIINALK